LKIIYESDISIAMFDCQRQTDREREQPKTVGWQDLKPEKLADK
jgi:hypothetical protein